MSLLEAQRQRHKALGQRHGLGASEVIRQLRHDFEQETGTEARGPKSAAASQYQVAGFGFKAREDATSVAAARAEEIHGLFKTTEKKTNVLEVVRSVVNDTQEQKQVEPLDKSRKKIFKTLKRRMSDMHGDDLANSKIFGFLLGDGIWETCAACMNAWQNWFRRIKFERNRQSMRAALAWDDPERASAVMRARETLAKSDQVTWLSVQFCRKVNEEKLQSSVYPVTSPPKLRRESGETFSALAQELRHQLAQLLRQQMAAASEAERGVVQRWIIKEKTKDVKKAEARDEAAAWQLECAKRKLHQSPALAALFQQLYISSLTFSVEKTATTLTQMFADPSYLMIRIMAMPFAKETGEAMLVTSPNHADIQAHLNALLESVVSVAGRAPIVWQPRKPSMAEVAGEDLVVEMEHEKEDKDASAALQRSLMRSSSYRLAVRGLDAQLRRSFQVVERRLQGLQGQLEPMLLAQSAVLSQLYLDRRGLFEQILSVADKKPDAPRRSPAECEPDATTLTSPFLADFVMFWLSRPQHLERHGLPEKISVLLMNLFYSLAKVVASEKKATLPVAPLQPDTAACLSPVKSGIAESAALATIIADSVDGKGGGCASFHTALASVVDGSKSFLDLLLRPDLFLLRPAEFLGTVRGATYELSMVEGLCEWIRNLQRSCEQWERAVRNTRALSQCGPFALDFRYFSFIAEQTSPALLSLSTYALNIYAVNCGKRLWKEIYDWLQRFRKPPASVDAMLLEKEWLSRAEQNMGHFQSNLRQLTPLIACLAAVTRSRLFTERLADVESGRSSTVEEVVEEFLLDFKDDDEGREAPGVERKDRRTDSRPAHGVGHPYGGLSTGTLQYLCLQSGEIFSKLQENVEKVLVTPERFGPMEELEREELLAAAEAAKVPEEAEEPLSPSISFALGRCGMARGVGEDVELAENARLKEEEESKQDKSHKEDKAKEKPEERKNSQVGSVDGSAVGEARKSSVEAQMQIRQDLQDLRSRCFRLFYLEDEVLLELMASSANVKMQQQIVSRCIPQLFPGWSAATFARHLESGTSSGGGLEHRSSSKRLASKRVTAHSDWVITAAETSGPSLQLLQAVPLHLPLQEWLHRLEQSVARSFAAALREESPHHWRSNELQQLRCSIEKQSLEQRFVRDQIPEHVAVTAERIRWTYIVEAWSSYEESLELLSAYLEHRVKEEVAQNTAVSKACAGAALMLMLELRALLGQAKEHQHEAQKLKFLRMAWRSAESLAVELGPLILEFGWELYGGEQLICPATERCYVELAQHLCATATCPVLQGTLGSTVTRAFAACCGIACHQCSILEPGQFRFCTGAGLLGHWVILHGIDDLEPQPREAYLKFLSKFFLQLSQSLEVFRDKRMEDPLLSLDFLNLNRASSNTGGLQFAKLPPGSMKVHNVSCTFDTSKLLFSRSDRGRATSFSFEARRREVDMEIEVGSLRRSHSCPAKQTLGGAESALEFEVKAQIVGGIPRSLHPAVALWAVAAEGQAGALHGQPLRNLSFPPADLTLYIHAGLIRIGILDMDAARMLTRAISAFNTFSGAEASTSTRLRKGRHPHISIGEIRSICTFAASFKRAHSSHDLEARTKTLDEQILCEAWLCAIGAQLDAGPQREMLWRCTVMSFGHSACFEAQQHALRQNLFNDTLMAQRVAKKDLSTRFYIRIADTLRQKFSFDFYNPMVVQKCIATTQALLNDRDVAVVGDAGAGKTDCIMTLLEAAEDFPDDLGRPLFPRVKLLRINTLAHNVEGTLMVVARAAETECKRITTATDEREDCIWLTLDGPVNPELFEAVSSAMPLTMAGRPLSKARAFRMIVETDNLAQLSPATAAGLAVTYIDTERGPTWKDRAMAWTHRFVLSRPEYAHFMNLTSELLMHLMDSILAFVLYYFHFNPSEISAAATEGEALDYRHQTSCFLSLFTSFLVDPVVEKQLIAATEEGEEALERQVRLLIGMSSISAFGASLFTSQRPRFERYIRENVLDPIHADSFPSLYDLYFDSKSGQFQAVGQIVNMKEPLVEAHNICVATEEFVAFQLRLHRLLSINAPVLLAGTAGSGKSALLRYLNGCSSSSTVGLLRNCPDLEPTELQQVLTMNLSEGSTGVLEPGNEKRLVVFIDDLHLSSIAATSWRLQAVGQQYRGRGSGGQSQLGEWIRFALESQGFYRDGHFVPIRDTSFLPSLLAPNSQNLEVCKRFTRHFFLAFMEIPSEASIQNIFSTILTLNLSVGLPDEVLQNLTATFSRIKLHPNVEIETPGQKLAAQLLQATLAVWAETDWATKQRLHGLARVFWDVAHAFSRVPVEELRSQLDVGYLWAFVMRTSVLDALLLPEAASHRRRVYGAVARSCKAHFGLLLGGKAGLEDPDLQTLELDSLAFSAIVDGQIELSPPGLRSLRRVNLVQARDDVLQRIGNPAYVTSHEGQLEKEMSTSSHSEESEEEGMADEESENELDQPPQEPEGGDDGSGEFSIDRKFKKQRNEDTEQAAPDPVSLVMCKELLSIDNDASLMWLLQEETLCTLLRLSHVLTTYPITCLVGGWTHLPLLGLVGKLLAGSSRGELHLCTNVTAESLERELLKSSSAVQQTRRKPQKLKAQQKKVEGGLRVLCVSEHDFPAEAPEAYLAREQSRFFRPGGGALGDANDEKCVSKRDEVEEDGQKRLVVICRSPASLQELFTRCGFLRQTLVATFNVLPPMSLQQVAFVYLGKRLSSRIDLGALPKAQKKLLMHRSHFLGSQGGRASIKKFAKGATTGLGQSWQQQLFIPLAKIVESLHLRIRDVLAVELGRDVALEFCSASRFSMFVQTIARLAMHHRSVQNHRGTMHESARNRLKSLEKFLVDLDTKLRSMHVSLKLLAEESRRLLSRSAREHELQTQATASLAEVRERKKLVESHIAAVDARHGSDFEKALSTAASSLRQLKQLERCHFESLAQYQHLPAPLVRALGAAKAVLLHVSGAEEGEDASVPIFKRRRVPSSALAAACAAAGGAQVGVLKVSKTPTRAEIFEWADALAKPQTLEVFNSWDGTQPLPGWLAEVLQSFLLSPDCHFSTLWSMSPAASRLSQWLHGRLECHRVLMRMEDDRQSMGDLSTQLIEVTAAVKAAEAELKRAEDTLERLQAAHAETVQKRQLLLRTESGLQRQSARATRVLEIAAPRRRECEVVVPLLRDAEESPEQWGAILTIGVLSCYGASFGHALRQPIMKELQQVLQEGGVPTPSNLFTSAYLRGFFPQTLVQKAVDAWPNSHLLQGTVATEASGSLCALMLDPFGNALEWLKELHTQRNPVASGGGDRSEFDKHLQRLLESRGIAKEPGVADGDVNNFEDSENEWEDMPQAKASDQDCVQPMLCSSNETPELLTSKLQHCMLEGQIMILQLEDLSSLRGFVGTLLVLLSGSSAQVRLTTERHSVLFSLSQRFTRALAINAQDVATGVEAESDELRVRVFSMLQRLEAALPMVHYHFHLYVIAPRCHWSRCLWGPAKTKQAEQLMKLPSAILSTCTIISMDPLHPAQVFLPSFMYAKEAPNTTRKRQEQNLVLMAQETRLLVIEELILHLLCKMDNSDMQSDKVVRPLQKFNGCASRLAASVSLGLQERQQRRKNEKRFLPLASTVALLQCALIDSELAADAVKGLFMPIDSDDSRDLTRNVHKEVDGFAMRPLVLQVLLQHQLKSHNSAKDAVSALLETVYRGLGPQQASLLRLFLLLESREQGLTSLWHSMVSAVIRPSVDLDSSRSDRRQSVDKMNTNEAEKEGFADAEEGGSDDEDGGSSDDSDSDSDDEEEDEDENRSNGDEDADGEEENEDDEADGFTEDDVLEVVPATKILSPAFLRRMRELWSAVQATVPVMHPKRSAKQQLARLPSKAPLLVPTEAIPLLRSLAKTVEVKVQEISLMDQLQGRLEGWLVYDLAECKDFQAMESLLVAHLEGVRKRKSGRRGAQVQDLIAGQAVTAAIFREMLEGQDQPYQEPTRWILHCSAATAEIPKSILRHCFCIQNVIAFFGISETADVAQLESDGALMRKTQSTASSTGQPSEVWDFTLVGRDERFTSPQWTEALGSIVQRHPLLTVCSSVADEKQSHHLLSSMMASIKAAGLHNLSFLHGKSLSDWAEEHLLIPALPWAQERRVGAVLQSFSPTLTHRSDGETYHILGALSMKISGFLQQLASMEQLTLESPFWLSLEISRASHALEDVRRECIACHAALAGDVCWTAQLYAVYKSAQLGMAHRANRPLAAWLASWAEHVNFLTNWDPKSSLDSKPFRLASVSDISTVLSSYYREGGLHHLWFEGVAEKHVSEASEGDSGDPSEKVQLPQLLVEGLRLVGARWANGGISKGREFECEVPPAVIRLSPGAMPVTSSSSAWYLCPLVVSWADAFGTDLVERPVAHVYVRTSVNPALCALHGVRLVSSA